MNALEVKNLCKSYTAFKLDNISFSLPEGCIMGLIGENGAGKSTTIKLILDAVHPTAVKLPYSGETTGRILKRQKKRSAWCWTRHIFRTALR